MAGTPAEELRPLVRLGQIVEELRRAAERNDLEVVCAAAHLLAPTLKQCTGLPRLQTTGTGDAGRLARQIQVHLAESEAILTSSMSRVAAEIKRVRVGKQALSLAQKDLPARGPAIKSRSTTVLG